MEDARGGLVGRLFEKTLGWVILGGLIAVGLAIYRMGPTGRAALWEGIWRTAAWLAFAAVLPWSGRLFIGRILEIGSNWAGVVLLAALLLLDVICGLILLGGLPSGGWSWVAALAALGVVGTYNFLVTEYLSEEYGA